MPLWPLVTPIGFVRPYGRSMTRTMVEGGLCWWLSHKTGVQTPAPQTPKRQSITTQPPDHRAGPPHFHPPLRPGTDACAPPTCAPCFLPLSGVVSLREGGQENFPPSFLVPNGEAARGTLALWWLKIWPTGGEGNREDGGNGGGGECWGDRGGWG